VLSKEGLQDEFADVAVDDEDDAQHGRAHEGVLGADADLELDAQQLVLQDGERRDAGGD
jgi:hypothetical protein